MPESGVVQGLDDLAGRSVGQMAMHSAYTPFEKYRIRRLGQQLDVVVALQQEGVAPREMCQQVSGRMPKVGQNPQLGRTIGACKLQRLTGIVRNGKRRDLQAAEVYGVSIPRDPQQAAEVGRSDGLMGAFAHPHRNPVAQCKPERTADVIPVLMGDENRIDVFVGKAGFTETPGQLFEPESAIDKQAERIAAHSFNHRGVTAAAATQVFEAQHAGDRPSPVLFQIVCKDLHNALCIGRRLGTALCVTH